MTKLEPQVILDDTRTIQLKKPIEIMQQAYISETIMKMFRRMPISFPVGIKELDIAKAVRDHLENFNFKLAAKGYKDFPSDISISKNNKIAHGIPSEDLTKNGDVLTLDIVCEYNGWYADMSWTFFVGTPSEECVYLINTAWELCIKAMNVVKVGNTLKDVAYEVLSLAAKKNVFVYNQFVGHGIGRDIHELPYVRYDKNADDIPIQAGMVLCVEPIISLKPQKVIQDAHGTYIGVKKHPTAVFEHMVGVFENESKVLSWGMKQVEQLPVIIIEKI